MSTIESWESHHALLQLLSDNLEDEEEIPTLARRLSDCVKVDWTIRDNSAVHRNMLKGIGGEPESVSQRVALYGVRKSNSTTRTRGVTPPGAKKRRR